jgi:hypothetical protein
VVSWFTEPSDVGRYCGKCGAAVILACPSCNAPLPGDPEMLQWVPYHGNCPECGKAYPWKADDVARAKRTLAEQAQVEAWSDVVKARADELVDDIAADRATASSVSAALNWLSANGAETARGTIVETIDRLGGESLRHLVRWESPDRP